jgi:hypothetical protein
VNAQPQLTFRALFAGVFDWSRVWTRAFGVLGILLLTATWRIDGAVRTAYSTAWTHGTYRLPGINWEHAYVGVSLGAFLCLLAAVLIWEARPEVGPKTKQTFLQGLAVAGAIFAGVTAVLGAYFRSSAATGGGVTGVKYAVICDVVALAALGLAVLFVAVQGAGHASVRVHRMLQRHRMNLIGVAGLAIVMTVVPQTSGQAIDSIRTWVTGTGHSMDRLSFGLATAVLLALVVYESSVRLTRITATIDQLTRVAWWKWLAAAVFLAGLWVVGWKLELTGPALLICAAILAVVCILELVPATAPDAPPGVPAIATPPKPDEPTAEYLAIVPLLSISAITIAAAIDAALSETGSVGGGTLYLLAPAATLAVVAVIMTRGRGLPQLSPLEWWRPKFPALLAGAAVLAVTVLLIGVFAFGKPHDAEWFAAGTGFVFLALGIAYAWVLFHADEAATARLDDRLVAIPVAFVTGLCVFLGLHYDVHAVGNVLGVFGVVNLSLAFILAELSYVIGWSLRRRAPRLLEAIGMQQLPILFLVAVAWVTIGLIKWPVDAHDARVTDRQLLPGRTTYVPRPSLETAFNRWAATQAVRGKDSPGNEPVPLVLVATHGGGIRAAYWTALALDCIVAVSSDGATLDDGDPSTCETVRRDEDGQRRAARRIFLASGVSGGAVGLHAYAERLLRNHGALGDRTWVPERLGSDFAADTMGWALFHDLPNHFFGVHSRPGGKCRAHLSFVNSDQCLTQDRAAVLEQAFDRRNGADGTGLRYAWDLRASAADEDKQRGESVPLLILNSTVAGGKTRAITSAANLSDWPGAERSPFLGADSVDTRPLAGTPEVSDALCTNQDVRLSTAAILAARFPYVSPSGRVSGGCSGDTGGPDARRARCADTPKACEMRLVDGGYAENSGLLSVELILPSLRELVRRHNASPKGARRIAIVLVELDNHYRGSVNGLPSPAQGKADQSLMPLETVLGAHGAAETYARAASPRMTPKGCTITIAPGLHPGLLAPLGWELSAGAQEDLANGLVRPRPNDPQGPKGPVLNLRILQQWLGDDDTKNTPRTGAVEQLRKCVPE